MRPDWSIGGINGFLLAGLAVGLVAWSTLPLRWGRRPIAITSVLLFSVASWLRSLMLSPLILISLQVLVGFGMGNITVVWMLELVQIPHRALVASVAVAGWAAGCYLAVAAVAFGHFTAAATAVLPTMPIVLSLLTYAILCPESPQVMALHWTRERTAQAMQRVARINKTLPAYHPLPEGLFFHRRAESAWAEVWRSPVFTLFNAGLCGICGALLCAARIHLVRVMASEHVFQATAIASGWLAAALVLAWGTRLHRRTLLGCCLFLSVLLTVASYVEPVVPWVLALARGCCASTAVAVAALSTAEWYPATCRHLGLTLGAAAGVAGAAGFWVLADGPDVRFAASAGLGGAGFLLALCRPETSALIPRLRSHDEGPLDTDEDEERYLLAHA
jgi:hypothetical protein